MEKRTSTSTAESDLGRVVAIGRTVAGAVVEFARPVGTSRVRLGACPDGASAARLLGCNRRAAWVLLELGATPRAEVSLVGHRVPTRLQISLATALGLAERGVPAYVCGGAP